MDKCLLRAKLQRILLTTVTSPLNSVKGIIIISGGIFSSAASEAYRQLQHELDKKIDEAEELKTQMRVVRSKPLDGLLI